MTEWKVSVGTMTLPLPNSINFINAFQNFLHLSDNSVVFSIVVSEFILYLHIMVLLCVDFHRVWPLCKVSLVPPDRMVARHVYQLTVTTGSMFGAGTTSRIGLQLFGSEATSPVKMLNPIERSALVRGSTLHFVMPVRESLGEVLLLRIWHDNSGKGDTASWFLGSFVVRDIETDVVSYFTCNDWLSREKGGGEVQKVVHASTEEDLTSFTNVFNEATRDVFYDKQLWTSALVAAPGSIFTKAQRLSCCFTLLNTMMLSSAMWYKAENTTADTRVLNLGFVRFTIQELYISLMTVLTVLPVNLVLLQLFRMEAPLSVNTREMSIRPSKKAPKKVYPPAKPDVKSARKKKELNKKSASALKEFLLLLLFVVLLFYIAQADKDQHAFYETQSLSNNILQEYDTIKTPDQFYAWTEDVLLPTLYPATWYNGRDMKYLDRQFAHNTGSFRLGPPRLTQVRKLPGSTSVASIGWSVSGNCWRFNVTDVFSYPNGTPECTNHHSFDVPLNHDSAVSFFGVLKDNQFFDKYTKSVTIAINFYNPSLKLFSVVNMIINRSGLGFERFVDLQTAAWWDACFKHILGLVVFINTISLLRVVRFSQTIGKLLALPGIMKEELLSFLVVAAIAFIAFISSAHLIFGSHMESYADLYHTTFALFEMMLGRFFAQDMLDSNPLTGPIFFSSFMICIFILLMNFLMTIVCDAISADVDVSHDQELGEYIWRSFRAMLGFHSTPDKENKPGELNLKGLEANIVIIQEKLDEGLDICNSILPSRKQVTSDKITREDEKLSIIVDESHQSTTVIRNDNHNIQKPTGTNVDTFDIDTEIQILEQEFEEEKNRKKITEHHLLTEIRVQTKQIEDILVRVNRATTKPTVQKVPRCIQVAAAPTEKRNVSGDTQNGKQQPAGNTWISDLKLTAEDKAVLLSDEVLTDKHIHAAQMLLRRQYPGLGGLQDTTVGASSYGYTRVSGEGLQIHHTGQFHWVLSSSIGGHVSVYNSIPGRINALLESQLRQCYAPVSNMATDVLTVKVPCVQLQESGSTCGLFAIAWAVDIAMGTDVTQVRYNESKMRAHLLDCFERGHLSPFPRVRQVTRRRASAVHRISLACRCGQSRPSTKLGGRVKCRKCHLPLC
ncbi:PREDICTED: uncharacterized protein LOC109472030 [Branchiostoma belcheri]|uniref:Uncharacterized protein LOC109472030 n=1 Tax=Branchiostoma belcheri TaxID=7741 RepID=A0A6P4YZN7_BRABE|nr:PREDICTED: uncharacterized protein LOC109472030 [Branchiostoma belcheri]